MEITRLAELKPRSVWEIIDDAFDLYRERFTLLACIAGLSFAPALILISTVVIGAFTDLSHVTDGPDRFWRGAGSLFWAVPLLGFAFAMQSGATAFAVRDALTGAPSNLLGVFQRTFRRIVPLLISSTVIGLFAMIAACIFIGPIFVFAWYVFTPHGILLEDRKLLDAAKRSRDMSGAYFGKILGILCLTVFIGIVMIVGFATIAEFAASLVGDHGKGTPYDREVTEGLISTVSLSLISVLIAPLPAIANTLLYYDLRVRREGLDIESEAESLRVPLAPDPFGGVLNPKAPKLPKAARK